MNLVFEPLRAAMARDAFDCGEPALNTYLRQQARQDVSRHFTTVIIAYETAVPDTIIGYYTLSLASVPRLSVPDELRRKMPRYSDIPAIRLGRLAVAKPFQSQHHGTLLVADALTRACRNELTWALFCVDAKNEYAARFYQKMMFKPFPDRRESFWMHRKQAERLIASLPRPYF